MTENEKIRTEIERLLTELNEPGARPDAAKSRRIDELFAQLPDGKKQFEIE